MSKTAGTGYKAICLYCLEMLEKVEIIQTQLIFNIAKCERRHLEPVSVFRAIAQHSILILKNKHDTTTMTMSVTKVDDRDTIQDTTFVCCSKSVSLDPVQESN